MFEKYSFCLKKYVLLNESSFPFPTASVSWAPSLFINIMLDYGNMLLEGQCKTLKDFKLVI